MTEDIKRINYFDGLLLKQEDFNLEQDYHIRMRRLHNRNFHKSGIIRGLDLQYDIATKTATVTQGIALDQTTVTYQDGGQEENSREIVLSADYQRNLSDYTGTVYFYIHYKENTVDPDKDKGGGQEIHWLETAEINQFTTLQTSAGENIYLGKVNLTDGTVDTTGRPEAGFYGKTGEVDSLIVNDTLTMGIAGQDSNLPTISGKRIDNQNGMEINGPLSVIGDLTVQGISTALNMQTLEVEDNIITLNKYENGGSIPVTSGVEIYRGADGKKAQLLWDENNGQWQIGTEDEKPLSVSTGGNVNISGNLTVNGDLFKVDSAGNLNINGALDVNGSTTINTLTVNNKASLGMLTVTGQTNIYSISVNPMVVFSGDDNNIAFIQSRASNQTNSANLSINLSGGLVGIGTKDLSRATLEISSSLGTTAIFNRAKGVSLVANNPGAGFNCYYSYDAASKTSKWKNLDTGYAGAIWFSPSNGAMCFDYGGGANTGADSESKLTTRLYITNTGTVEVTGKTLYIGGDGYYAPVGEENFLILRGTVHWDTSKKQPSSYDGKVGWSVTNYATDGKIVISFNPTFSGVPTVVASLYYYDTEKTRDNAMVTGVSNSGCTIITGDNDGNLSTRSFSFIAVGPR